MTESTKLPPDSPLARWSRLKREAAREKEKAKESAAKVATTAAGSSVTSSEPAVSGASSAPTPVNPGGAPREVAGGAAPSDELPPVESLSFDSDFAPYFQPQVDAALKRQALKQLLRDPRFNVMDGLDVYIDDYTQPDPIPPEIVREMVQGRYIFDPPPTRVNAQGHVEDVPAEELAALKDAKGATGDDALASGEALPALANSAPEPVAASSIDSSSAQQVAPVAIPSAAPVAKDDSAR